eukprot:4345597-Amphidinium_carterae.1
MRSCWANLTGVTIVFTSRGEESSGPLFTTGRVFQSMNRCLSKCNVLLPAYDLCTAARVLLILFLVGELTSWAIMSLCTQKLRIGTNGRSGCRRSLYI